ncbi:YqcC family protein [Cronobacter turicensis]|uniref:YqcC family protein n=1 Tax=unclassified Cronobacter TaxID=2649764 RepID=UPI0013ED85AB|nr:MULTISPECIES: YqcC family protein [unclassified Cronobacter]ELQ6226882.1 YqcC family protein [Cronobacter turicensis]KAF6593632.1 YqcC family protein [Cronobacter sp. EKM102R]KAF6594665.1 YqcC family protein [Cronobacter sp. EKM101R]
MERHQRVRQQLQRVEQVLRHHQQWQIAAPDSSAFESTQPFCMDTLEPYEWLQWVLIPRLHALLDAGAPLPQAFAVAPYYEVVLEASHPARDAVLVTLVELDALFAGDDA